MEREIGETRERARHHLRILLLCDDDPGHANTTLDHIRAFSRFSCHEVYTFNPRLVLYNAFLDLNEFDVVVIHYTLAIIDNYYLSPSFRKKIKRFSGLKVQFIQDEYRRVDQFTAMTRYLGIRVLFSMLPPTSIQKLYNETRLPGVVKVHTLAGYVPDDLRNLPTLPLAERPIDIGYRGRAIPFWLGRFGQEKRRIAEGVLERANRYGLRCDIAWREEDRIYGDRWTDFLRSCRSVLGTESGVSITDFDGSIERQTREYLSKRPHADFEEVYREILEPHEGNFPIKVISPRVFEAAALGTALILFPGEYSGILEPWRHYLPLAPDFSNMDRVVERLRDRDSLSAMTERAHADLVASGRYSHRVLIQQLDELVATYGTVQGKPGKLGYHLARLERVPFAAGVDLLLRGRRKLRASWLGKFLRRKRDG